MSIYTAPQSIKCTEPLNIWCDWFCRLDLICLIWYVFTKVAKALTICGRGYKPGVIFSVEKARHSSASHLNQLLLVDPKQFPRQPRDIFSPHVPGLPRISSHMEMPGTPPHRSVQEASWPDAWTTLTGCFQSEGEVFPALILSRMSELLTIIR